MTARSDVSPPPPRSAYRAHASHLFEEAGQARFAEARRSLFDVARWYAALASHLERWREPALSNGDTPRESR